MTAETTDAPADIPARTKDYIGIVSMLTHAPHALLAVPAIAADIATAYAPMEPHVSKTPVEPTAQARLPPHAPTHAAMAFQDTTQIVPANMNIAEFGHGFHRTEDTTLIGGVIHALIAPITLASVAPLNGYSPIN